MSENKEPLNKNNKVPKLRLKKYKSEPLKQSKLIAICSFSKGSGLTKDDLNNTGYPCILYGELYTRYLGEIIEIISKTTNIPQSPKYSKKGDIILPLSGETPLDISNSAVVPESNVLLGGDMLILTPKHGFDSLFLSYYVSNCKKKEIARKACGISIIHSHKNEIEKLLVNYPSLNEQKDISTLFSLVSKKERIIMSKIEALKKYKEGFCNTSFKEMKNDGIMLSKLVTNKPSQLLTQHIEKNAGDYPVYDASGEIYKTIDFYNNNQDSVSIIKYGSGCGRTFIAKGKHSVLGTMTELIPVDNIDCHFIYAFTSSSSFKRIVKKYKEIGTTPNLYYSDYSKAIISNKAISNKETISSIIKGIENKESRLSFQLEKLKQLKKTLLSSLFI